MANNREMRDIAKARLKSAKLLLEAEDWLGSIYMMALAVECERLQSLPDDYTEGVSNTQRYKALGNAFNVDVVAHILSFIPHDKN